MAMGDSEAGHSDWMHLYRDSIAAQHQPPPAASPAASSPLQPERRVAKPARRRSRASRKAPTTLVSTDTSNFRAMVQQYTGVPTPPSAATPFHGVYHPVAELGGRLDFRIAQNPTQQHAAAVPMQFGAPPPQQQSHRGPPYDMPAASAAGFLDHGYNINSGEGGNADAYDRFLI